ncbi:MAG: helix-turn-helix transcriptional regulator [Lachnospiraceae bacterium]|nr:helix-turn-helix transcriptional regulator [Lachnospiraceae bacterium]MBP1585955.1 helix-turn-helix transcriptional regulator [Lachnospiraceae bacterium]
MGVITDDISGRIRQILEERNMSAFELTKCCTDVGRTSVYNAVNGKKNSTVVTIDSICNGLEVSLSDFFDWTGEAKVTPSKNEQILLENYRSLDKEHQGMLRGYLKALMEDQGK